MFSYHRMCSLTAECVLLLQNVLSLSQSNYHAATEVAHVPPQHPATNSATNSGIAGAHAQGELVMDWDTQAQKVFSYREHIL